MASEWTPSTEDVREAYLLAVEHFHDCGRTLAEHREQWDRWLAAHDAEVRTEAGKGTIAAIAAEWRSASGMFSGPEIAVWLDGLAARIGGAR